MNDTIDAIYAGTLPEPIEVSILKNDFGLAADLFGNATNLSDQVDPYYRAPGGADPEHPHGGFQFTPELAVAIGILQVRNFGLGGFDAAALLAELQVLVGKHGSPAGEQIWNDRNFLNDPLAPVSVPDPNAPGFGGPLAAARPPVRLGAAARFPRFDYEAASRSLAERRRHRAEFAQRLGAWPMMGSYAWMIGGGKSASGYPWIGGFPQTGIQTPSIMHFAENRSAEGSANRVRAVGMEFVGAPLILIGHTDSVAYTTTTAQLLIVDTFFEELINEDTDSVRYDDEGTPAPLARRTETFRGSPPTVPDVTRVFWRSHVRGGNGGSRPIVDFLGDAEGTVSSATATTLSRPGAFDAGYAGGHVVITDGKGAGQMRAVSSATANTLTIATPWTDIPNTTSVFVAVRPGNSVIAVALDSPTWREETTTVLGFSLYQRAESILDVRKGARLIPSTHNFLAADNKAFNGIGTASGNGNIGYWSSGFARIRQGGLDPRLPLDGTGPNPLVAYSGTVAVATATTLKATAPVFGTDDLSPPPPNFRYLNPSQQGSEYIVTITSGAAHKQTRRIAANTGDTLTLESELGVVPQAGDTFEVYEIAAMPEAINPSEGFTANWNNKAATADEGDGFGRQHRVIFILERLASESAWDREKQRQLNRDVAGLDGRGKFGRYLIPRLRQAVNAVGNGGNPAVDSVLAALEAHNGPPFFGRLFIDPVLDLTVRGEVAFLNSLVNQLAADIYGDEYSGAVSTPTGTRALHLVQHAIDSAAGDLPGGYAQAYGGDYFNGTGWQTRVRDTLSALAAGGIPADSPRPLSFYRHPLRDAFLALGNTEAAAKLDFEPTLSGNRGIYEQIVEVGPAVRGEFIFPLGQSGLIQGVSVFVGVSSVDPNFTSLHPIWRDWRFVPMLQVAQDLAGGGDGDLDNDGVLDAYERWHFGDLSRKGRDDGDGDRKKLRDEYREGLDPTRADTDGDGIPDGVDALGQDRLRSGILKLRGKIRFGDSPGTDKLVLLAQLGTGSPEFDPATRDIQVTLRDDNAIYSVTIPAGTLTPNAKGNRFVYRDPAGSLNALYKAVFAKGNSGRPSKLKISTVPTNLSAADNFDPIDPSLIQITTEVVFGTGAHSIVPDTRLWKRRGPVIRPLP